MFSLNNQVKNTGHTIGDDVIKTGNPPGQDPIVRLDLRQLTRATTFFRFFSEQAPEMGFAAVSRNPVILLSGRPPTTMPEEPDRFSGDSFPSLLLQPSPQEKHCKMHLLRLTFYFKFLAGEKLTANSIF
ncbi:hypothetical protein CDAR_95051 [Caerostris darwini]|uniref:Uncharacterized protein n=1 Tax=Caerostris darwini TaxID=1538125 RepID=A0AAV4PKS7_9ARAC|nr:hypothetical protein CDAR_95051 [Caerostris darwini]